MGWKEALYLGKVTEKSEEHYYYRQSLFQLFRPLTLSGTITPVLAATALASKKGDINITIFLIVLVASLCVQIAINIFNDYFDFKSGQDAEKWTLDKEIGTYHPAHYHLPYIAGILLLIAASLGIYLALVNTFLIILIGLISILFGYAYSAGTRSLASLGLGELVAFVFLGYIVTFIAYTVQGQPLNMQIFSVATPFALIIASMILTNNLRDIEKDKGFRRTLVIIYGEKWGVHLLSGVLLVAYSWVILMITFGILPFSSLLVFFALPMVVRLRFSFRKNATRGEKVKAMKIAATHHWVFGLLFALGLFI